MLVAIFHYLLDFQKLTAEILFLIPETVQDLGVLLYLLEFPLPEMQVM